MVKHQLLCTLLLLLFPIQHRPESVLRLNRCCSPGHTLSIPGDRCLKIYHSQVTNYTTFDNVPIWKNQGTIMAEVGEIMMPKCKKKKSCFIGSQASLTEEGGLVTNIYGNEFPHGDFCLEYNFDHKLMAVMCNPCEEKICLNLCCPHGLRYTRNYNEDLNTDLNIKDQCSRDNEEWLPKFWNLQNQVEVKLEKHSDYLFQYAGASKKSKPLDPEAFYCPVSEKFKFLPDEIEFQKFQLSHKYMKDNATIAIGTCLSSNKTRALNNSEFCVTYADLIDYDNYEEYVNKENKISTKKRVSYFVCTPKAEEPKTQCVSTYLYPISLSITIIFHFLTLIVHIILPKLHGFLIGKMTIGFLINILICYICLAYHEFITIKGELGDAFGTPGCNFRGYLLQYTYLSFFFWLNSMAAYTLLKTTGMVHFNNYLDIKLLIIFYLYSQMFPFFVSISTAIMDVREKDYYYYGDNRFNTTRWKPSMGKYLCFLGYKKQTPDLNFFQRPQFIYFHSFVISLIILNVIYLVVTLILIIKSRHSSEGYMINKYNFQLVSSLFFLIGIPYVIEIVGNLFDISCWATVLTISFTIFEGPLIFLVPIMKKEILASLKAFIMEKTGALSHSRDHIVMTTLTREIISKNK